MTRNALLTETQRNFLYLSEEEREAEYSKQQRSYHRNEIRERVAAGVADFSLLLEHWDESEWGAISDGTTGALAFFFARFVPASADDPAEFPDEMKEKKPGQYVTDSDQLAFLTFVLERALDRACEARGHNRRYEIEISPKEPDQRSAVELQQQLREEKITLDEIERLYEEGRISRDTFATVVVESDTGDD